VNDIPNVNLLHVQDGEEFLENHLFSCVRLRLRACYVKSWSGINVYCFFKDVYQAFVSVYFVFTLVSVLSQLLSCSVIMLIQKSSGFPFFCEMQWYVLERYVDTLGHVTHRAKYDGETKNEDDVVSEAHRGRRPRGRGGIKRGIGRKIHDRVLRTEAAADSNDDDSDADDR
jgi:hypothetical protein